MQNKKFIAVFVLTAAVSGMALDASAQLKTYYGKNFDRSASKTTWNFYSYQYARKDENGDKVPQERTWFNNPRTGVNDPQNVDGKPNPQIIGNIARFKLHTHSPKRLPGGKPAFEGVDMYQDEDRQNDWLKPLAGPFAGIARAKIKITKPAPAGAVFGFFAVTHDAATRDEIDFEFLNSQLPHSLWLNIYKGGKQLADEVGVRNDPERYPLTRVNSSPVGGFHVYTMRYSTDAVNWHIGDVSSPVERDTAAAAQTGNVKSETSFVPTRAMSIHVNAWVPDTGWPEANSQALNATLNSRPYNAVTNPTGYQTYYFDVEWIQIGNGLKSVTVEGRGKPTP